MTADGRDAAIAALIADFPAVPAPMWLNDFELAARFAAVVELAWPHDTCPRCGKGDDAHRDPCGHVDPGTCDDGQGHGPYPARKEAG